VFIAHPFCWQETKIPKFISLSCQINSEYLIVQDWATNSSVISVTTFFAELRPIWCIFWRLLSVSLIWH